MHFYKYQGTGNDFIVVDSIDAEYTELSQNQIAQICHRRFGIGADGFIVMASSKEADFEMIYYNSDGKRATMCGNGGRCISQFYFDQGYKDEECIFKAIDGLHKARQEDGVIYLQMHVQSAIEKLDNSDFMIDTGSPHYIRFCSNAEELNDIVSFGKLIRYSDKFKSEGINVNLVLPKKLGTIEMRTYERGVEDETYSCGTGVVAAALVYADQNNLSSTIDVITKGGQLSVQYKKDQNTFSDIKLIGPAKRVFQGEYYF